MAGVVVDSDVLLEWLGIEVLLLTPSEEAFEEGDRLLGVFEVTEGLGFEAEVQVLARFPGEILDRQGAGIEVLENKFFVCLKLFEGAR